MAAKVRIFLNGRELPAGSLVPVLGKSLSFACDFQRQKQEMTHVKSSWKISKIKLCMTNLVLLSFSQGIAKLVLCVLLKHDDGGFVLVHLQEVCGIHSMSAHFPETS